MNGDHDIQARPHAPAAVAKDGGVWRWNCRTCLRSEWRTTHPEALREVTTHLAGHARFGFGGGGKR